MNSLPDYLHERSKLHTLVVLTYQVNQLNS